MGKLAVVTGASGGIGLELCRILATEGYDLVISARSKDKLEEIGSELSSNHQVTVTMVAVDLADAKSREELFELTPDVPDVLINNAGFGDYGMFSECDWDKQEQMIKLNDLALTHITRLYLPGMIAKGNGRILNIASVASFQPGPLMSVYYASKAYVLSFSEALSVELKGSGITVTAVCPGPVNTGFAAAANAESVNLFKKNSGADAKDVAEFAYRKMMKGKAVAIHGVKFKIALFFVKILPRGLVRNLIYRIQRSRTKQ